MRGERGSKESPRRSSPLIEGLQKYRNLIARCRERDMERVRRERQVNRVNRNRCVLLHRNLLILPPLLISHLRHSEGERRF